ncbi:MAG: YcaQ family DNA glycosylase [Phycisphaerae bacterium]|nr:YcaQ family DNA glycosylase [Phycisphaerae bacterium]
MPLRAEDARRVLLHLQGLSTPPKRSSPKAVQTLVEKLGYVQIDSINVVERAHHLILGTRLEGYRQSHLAHALEKNRSLFEHWTHDACAIPSKWFAHWRHRFARYGDRVRRNAWWQGRFRGNPEETIRRTLERIRSEGPLRARDFEPPHDHESGGWWEWHPEKAALEHLWRSGELAIVRRERFEKVYDLTERAFPDLHGMQASETEEHHAWACREAIHRIGIGSAKEVAHFFHAISIAEARSWCAEAVRRGELVDVLVAPERGGKPVRAFALPDWKRLAKAPDEERLMLLCPFDPVIRERDRVERLFGFDYRFEAFVPAPKRVYGYYVLPILEGDRLIGRIDPKFDRAAETLSVRGPWWEQGVKADTRRRRRLADALDGLVQQIGATRWRFDAHRTSTRS